MLVAESAKDDPMLVANLVNPLTHSGFRVIGIDVGQFGETRASMPHKKVRFGWGDFFAYLSLH